ncbi:MAG: glycosyltransferase family 4 protein [Alistipes sp.]|nr:glycosyltransferase family 4 protein [Candidatus Alistipes equi]
MKIAFIGGRSIHNIGGIENYTLNLASHLVRLGHQCIVYCESNCNMEEDVNGIHVIHYLSFGGRFLCKILLSLRSTLNALFVQKNVEYFHYNAWPPSIWSWIPFIFGRKTLLEGHGLEWKRTKYSYIGRQVMHFMEWLTAITHRNILVVSNEQKEYFLKAYHKRSVSIPTAINLPLERTMDETILQKFNLSKNCYFLFLGRLVQDKNPDYLIKAFIQSGIKDWKLVIAGSNEHQKEYIVHLKEIASSNENIVFTGSVFGDEKETLLKYCAAFCIPSSIEGLAITLLEAMSYSKICIASDIASNREGLGCDGIWVRPENVEDLASALRNVFEKKEEFDILGLKSRQRVEKHFTWEKISIMYIDFLKSIS